MAGITAAVVAAVLAILSGGHFRNLLTLLVAVVNILFYCVVTRLDRAWRWLFILLILAGAAWMAVFVPGRRALEVTSMAFFGLVWLLSGAITLSLYLRETRAPEQEGE